MKRLTYQHHWSRVKSQFPWQMNFIERVDGAEKCRIARQLGNLLWDVKEKFEDKIDCLTS